MERTNHSQVDSHLFFFVVHQPGKDRPILDCSPLNRHLECPHFKMEDMKTAIGLIKQGDWLTKVDIKDAYLHVPLHESAARHMGISMTDGTVWKFKAMPFGLNTAPLVFTRIMRTALKSLREKGICLVAYLDDILIVSKSKEEAIRHTNETTRWLERLGFIINYKKSMVHPTQALEFLGLLVCTKSMSLYVTPPKITKIQREAKQILSKGQWPAKKLAATIGLMNSVCKATSPGILMTRFLQANLTEALNTNNNNWKSTTVHLWETAKEELRWWKDDFKAFNGRPFKMPTIECTIYTDASQSGWGGVCGSDTVSGFWSETESSQSSNMRELRAIHKTVGALEKVIKGKKLLIRSDNMTAIANIAKEGGNQNPLYIQLLKDLYWELKRLNCTVVMRHVPGASNVFADAASRKLPRDEYSLNAQAIQMIKARWGIPTVDLFATNENTVVPRFFSWKPDPRAEAIDAFSQDWSKEPLLYAHPPVKLLAKILTKVEEEKIHRLILVLPQWTSLPCWPLVMSHMIDHVMLPKPCLTGPPRHRLEWTQPQMLAVLVTDTPH